MQAARADELRGVGDLIARFTKAGRIDKAAEWVATKVLRRESCGCPERQMRLNSQFPFGVHRWPKLTIAIPNREDWYGVWSTWHALAHQVIDAGLEAHVEMIVVDQSPEHEDGRMIKQTVETLAANWQVDEHHRTVNRGGPIDARYLPMTEIMGTAAAKQYCFHSARGEWVLVLDSHILLEPGAIRRVYDWIRKPANRNSSDLFHGVLQYDNHKMFHTHLEIWNEDGSPRIGDDGVFGQWVTDPRGQSSKGKPFEVAASGGWCVLARRQAFLQVGYHHLMRGFGGEEGFIAERFRRAGRKVWCHPALQGVHRFGRRSKDLYHVTVGEKARNHVIGWLDLGFDLEQLRAIWAPKIPSEVDGLFARTVAEFQADASGRRAPAPQPAQQPVHPQPAPDIESLYRRNCEQVSDINQHLPKLRELAEKCQHVTEFGTRGGVSTSAFLAAQPDELHSYDIAAGGCCGKDLMGLRGRTVLKYHNGPEKGDTIKIPAIPETDLLFIDTFHTAEQLRQELAIHSASVRKFIVLHDTVTYGPNGEGHTAENPVPGLSVALDEFLELASDYWVMTEQFENNNGLTVLSRKAV